MLGAAISLSIGIVGLPNVGKSTLFNALVKGSHAEAQNYPFCTIEPNVGIVEVPDERLKKLSEISKSKQTIPAIVEFVDIAGLVKGAHKGEGLGNKFLSHIRECQAIAMVVRFFEDSKITHVEGKISPETDIEAILTELQLADLQSIEKRMLGIDSEIKTGNKDAQKEKIILEKLNQILAEGKNALEANLDEEEVVLVKHLNLLTLKPILYIANCSEEQLVKHQKEQDKYIYISAKIESELNELNDKDKKEYLNELGVEDAGVQRLIKKAYKSLGLITFFTSGEKETRAWTVRNGAKAPEAAGIIHTDFERGFIAADVVKTEDFLEYQGFNGAKEKGLVKSVGKDYTVSDGDIMLFKFSV